MCMLVYARTHTGTQTTWVLDVSPGVGRTPGRPGESRSTIAHYARRPYRCTQYICLYICCAAGFESLTSVSIKDCTLRVPNKTTKLFLYEQ